MSILETLVTRTDRQRLGKTLGLAARPGDQLETMPVDERERLVAQLGRPKSG